MPVGTGCGESGMGVEGNHHLQSSCSHCAGSLAHLPVQEAERLYHRVTDASSHVSHKFRSVAASNHSTVISGLGAQRRAI